ncbi:MAG: hypothetical protein V4673_09170 [Pseudomonadota bacterium]
MYLFKTEMLFLEPPRTRFAYGLRGPRLRRYGRHALPRPDAAPADADASVRAGIVDIAEAIAAIPAPVVGRAA